jgi:replicative DNA helicase
MEPVLPQNIEAEESLLGAILIDSESIFKIVDIIRPDDFYKPLHQFIYQAILELFERHEGIDLVTVTNHLREKNQLETIGGPAYLLHLINKTPSLANVVDYAKIIREKKARRELVGLSQEINRLAIEQERPAEELLDEVEGKIFRITERVYPYEFRHISSLLEEAYLRIEELHKQDKKLRGLPTGYPLLDEYLGGLQNSDLVILAARPSLGKTALALNIARHLAIEEGIPVAFFSLEMSKDQIVDRLLASEAGVSLWRLRTGKLYYEGEINELAMVSQAMDKLTQAPIYIDDTPSLHTLHIRSMARKLKHQIGAVGLIIIDYLQLLRSHKNYDNRVQEMTEISRNLKELAKEMNLPVLALSQLSRAPEQRISQVPKLSDLRESGSLEQDADIVMFIHRPRESGQVAPSNQADIIIAKQRHGPLGVVNLYFEPETASFYSVETNIQQVEIH